MEGFILIYIMMNIICAKCPFHHDDAGIFLQVDVSAQAYANMIALQLLIIFCVHSAQWVV